MNTQTSPVHAAYAHDGVNIELGDDFSAFAAQVCRSTFKSRFLRVKDFAERNFRGPRGLHIRNLPKGYYLDLPSDGVGTKVGVITEALAHRTAPRDLFAMAASDITRWGGVPLAMANVLDVSSLGEVGSETYKRLAELVIGLGEVCREQGVVLMRGETAELGPYVGSENLHALTKFNWSCTVLGAYHPRRVIDGSRMKPGDAVVALRENGFRSNGLSSVRKAFAARFGAQWWQNPEAKDAIAHAAEPSVVYDRFLAHINGWYSDDFKPIVRLKAIAHISGGGIPGKFGEDLLFPQGLSARLDNLWPMPLIMYECLDWHPNMDSEEAYRVWNGGQGMLVVVEPFHAPRFCSLAKRHGIEAQVAGQILKRDEPSLDILSPYGRGWLTYHPKART